MGNEAFLCKLGDDDKNHLRAQGPYPLPQDICGNSKELPLNLQRDLNYFLESSYFLFPFYFKSVACPSRPGSHNLVAKTVLKKNKTKQKTTDKQKQTKNTNKTL